MRSPPEHVPVVPWTGHVAGWAWILTWSSVTVASLTMAWGLKPLATSQIPSDSSHMMIGDAAIAAGTEIWSQRPNMIAVQEATSGGTDEAKCGDDAGYEFGAVQHPAQQQCVDRRDHALSEQERPVVDGHERGTGCEQGPLVGSGSARQVLPQGHDREHGDDAGNDDRGFEHPCGEEAKGG